MFSHLFPHPEDSTRVCPIDTPSLLPFTSPPCQLLHQPLQSSVTDLNAKTSVQTYFDNLLTFLAISKRTPFPRLTLITLQLEQEYHRLRKSLGHVLFRHARVLHLKLGLPNDLRQRRDVPMHRPRHKYHRRRERRVRHGRLDERVALFQPKRGSGAGNLYRVDPSDQIVLFGAWKREPDLLAVVAKYRRDDGVSVHVREVQGALASEELKLRRLSQHGCIDVGPSSVFVVLKSPSWQSAGWLTRHSGTAFFFWPLRLRQFTGAFLSYSASSRRRSRPSTAMGFAPRPLPASITCAKL